MLGAKCPKCDKQVLQAHIVGLDGQVFMGHTWKSIAFTCPYCATILGIQMDPIAIKNDIVNDLFRKLRGPS